MLIFVTFKMTKTERVRSDGKIRFLTFLKAIMFPHCVIRLLVSYEIEAVSQPYLQEIVMIQRRFLIQWVEYFRKTLVDFRMKSTLWSQNWLQCAKVTVVCLQHWVLKTYHVTHRMNATTLPTAVKGTKRDDVE